MARTVVLVRHGKAEKAREGVADSKRRLTAAGLDALGKCFPQTFSLLVPQATSDDSPAAAPVIVWVSPAIRAQQTCGQVIAALSQNHIPVAEAEQHESLWHQDMAAFLDELAATPEDATVVAVGHIPFMSSVLERLCGADLAFRPGGVAAITVEGDPRKERPGELLWFVQGPKTK